MSDVEPTFVLYIKEPNKPEYMYGYHLGTILQTALEEAVVRFNYKKAEYVTLKKGNFQVTYDGVEWYVADPLVIQG